MPSLAPSKLADLFKKGIKRDPTLFNTLKENKN